MNWLKLLTGMAKAKPTPKKRAATIPPRPQAKTRSPLGESFTFPVVGESRFQEALARIVGGHNRDGHAYVCEARLVPEPTNAYDPQAIKVIIGGEPVGYIPKERTARLHSAMGGQAEFRCQAQINGGWRTNQHDAGHFGVKLSIPMRGPIA